MWFLTVFSATPRRSPISRFERPSPMSSRTLRSEGVRSAVGSAWSALRLDTVRSSRRTLPEATALIFSVISAPRTDLRRYAFAPAAWASASASGLRDDDEAVHAVDDFRDASAHHFVIVDDHDSDVIV